MKRLMIAAGILVLLQLFFVSAYEVQVDSFSDKEVVLAISGLQSINLKVTEVKATVESESVSDTYPAEFTLKTQGDVVLLTIDIMPLFEDYTKEQMKSITVSGIIDVEGEKAEFGKRIPIRDERSQKQFAPSSEESSSLIYWVVGLSLVLVLIILALFYRKPKEKILTSPRINKSSSRKRAKKRKILKKTSKKTKKKRL